MQIFYYNLRQLIHEGSKARSMLAMIDCYYLFFESRNLSKISRAHDSQGCPLLTVVMLTQLGSHVFHSFRDGRDVSNALNRRIKG